MTRVLSGLAVVGLMSLATAGRVSMFQDESRLWADAAAHAPSKPRPVLNAGRQAQLRGDVLGATAAYQRAIVLAHRPERGFVEAQSVPAVAEANLALLLQVTAHGRARTYMADALAAMPSDPTLQRTSAWIDGLLAR